MYVNTPVPIPISFFAYDFLIFFLCAVIGAMISYKAFRLYQITENKSHYYLYMAFAILSAGMLTLSISGAYVYVKFLEIGYFAVFDDVFGVDDIGYWLYTLSTFISYALLIMMYQPKKFDKRLFLLVPFTFDFLLGTNVILFFMMSYITLRSAMNYFSKRSANSMLVMLSFMALASYHALLFFIPYSKLLYAVSHMALISGFALLLLMLIRLNK